MSYPRIASYGGYRSNGHPLVVNGVLDANKVARLARYGTVSIHANTLHLRPDIVPALRAAGAKRILPYLTMTHWWLDAGFVPAASDTSLNAQIHRVIQSTGGFLPNPTLGYEVDWTNGNTAKGLTDLFVMLAGSGLYEGMFFDFASPHWEQEGLGERERNMRACVQSVLEAGGNDYRPFSVFANGIGSEALWADGEMREGFPQPFTSFADALNLGKDNWLKTEDVTPRAGRFGLGTALLVGATFCWGPADPSSFDGDHWLPEFDLKLGEPRGGYRVLDSGIYARWFDGGVVYVNPTGASIMVDTLVGTPRYVIVPAMDAVLVAR